MADITWTRQNIKSQSGHKEYLPHSGDGKYLAIQYNGSGKTFVPGHQLVNLNEISKGKSLATRRATRRDSSMGIPGLVQEKGRSPDLYEGLVGMHRAPEWLRSQMKMVNPWGNGGDVD